MTAVSARAEQPQPTAAPVRVVYICIDNTAEEAIARAWCQSKKINPKLVTRQLNIQRLMPGIELYILIRGEDRSPLTTTERDVHGRSHVSHKKPADLVDEVRITGPIRVADHWNGSTADEWGVSGELRRAAFMHEVGVLASPVAPRLEPGAPDVLHLTFE